MIPPEELPYGMTAAGLDPAALGDAVQAVISEALSDPLRMSTLMTQSFAAQQAAGLNLLHRLSGQTVDGDKVGDKRFADRAWGRNPFLLGIAESYLEQSRAALALVESSQLPAITRRKARFALQLMSDALAPTNVPWMNPAVVKEAMENGGASLVRGMQNFMADAQSNGGMPRQVDTSKFVLGSNLAATPGRIVFRNDLIELIAYEPLTADVHAIALVCSPPWINKYYIMDVAPGRSFIEWAVRHGHQTFAISYRNPDASMSAFRMDEYLERGLLAAIERIERITGSKQTNIAALCLGGTLALILLAYMAARGDAHRIGSATLTNSLVDFAEPGDLGVFTDESTISRLEEKMKEHGYLDSAEMAGTFNWMRSNDLIWSYVVNNWFMGKDPPAFDILAWNADSTRLPAAMHSQYLRACYLRNDLVRPGAFTIAGVPIDLGRIQTPLYVLGAEGDHIAPWRSTYRTVNHVGSSDLRYTLTNSGHVAGIANPPGNAKSEHWTKDRALQSESADEWRRTASYHKGTWWEDWATWAEAHAGPRTLPPDLPRGEAAPGRYVRNEPGEAYDPAPVPKPTTPKRATGKRTPQPRARRAR